MTSVDYDYRDLLSTRHVHCKVYADTIGKNVEVQLLFVVDFSWSFILAKAILEPGAENSLHIFFKMNGLFLFLQSRCYHALAAASEH